MPLFNLATIGNPIIKPNHQVLSVLSIVLPNGTIIPVSGTPDGHVDVNATFSGSITLGEIEIKNDVGNPVPVVLAAPNNPIIIRQENSTVPYDTETNIFSHTVAGLPLFMTSINMVGSWDGIFRIYINSVLKMQKRTSAAKRDANHYFNPAFKLAIGDTIDITVVHDYPVGARVFEATIVGYL